MHRVAYVIDHKLPRHDRWRRPGVQSTLETDPDRQAAEIAERFELREAPIVGSGHEIRVRVWPAGTGAELDALDPDRDEAAGQWTYSPAGS